MLSDKIIFILLLLSGALFYAVMAWGWLNPPKPQTEPQGANRARITQNIMGGNALWSTSAPVIPKTRVMAILTTYQAVPEQTDKEPCISASGMNVCETNKRIAACPDYLPFGTLIEIEGLGIYECQDKMAARFRNKNHFDLLTEENFKREMEVVIY